MASICTRCSLRLRRAAQTESQHLSKRSFSSTTSRQRGNLPSFHESSHEELQNVLSSVREKYFIPAYMHKQEHKLVTKQKFRQQLIDNPQTAIVGGEEITLQPINPREGWPHRRSIVAKAINGIINGETKDWLNLPMLLQGLNEGVKKAASDSLMEKIVRKAFQAKQLGVVIGCLHQAEQTGMTLKSDPVLRAFLAGLHDLAQESGWNKGALERALRDAKVISQLLESKKHGTEGTVRKDDPRIRPEVLGVFLELASVYAWKYDGKRDTEGLVKAYAERLLSNLSKRQIKPRALKLLERSKQWPMLQAIPIWHGLSLAEKILGKDMPQRQAASKAVAEYEVALRGLAAELEARNPAEGTYEHQALEAWRRCIRD
ncbi:hypothetical protein CLAFUW4_07598 [Fulvia fulva]|uniref:Uncharacterized protein n=1 Tax=Passalora fulva TaxID=5499 RepID=A0A9Q8LJA7_PASFU|nr:uncharacterized protein CLAFUR5_07728 [Fulvia fulva]KAK4621695.1 hypothetical protein CLAFUR4_07604 [Fulvia fulva]KAK4623233.1 hypothetical protein CLAFUR0_07603 [Fulvia fulva]UJO18446.1 hypothetical protein CLAFUR5_07728 [Fulvia fulva]WPV15896.1 hypothetical protein CLAFUW4_07598 [Fulvia fulva]WPV31125.1 hypothetical protein CLAFUW7_07600 [Fulvia fulva]